LIHSNGVDQQNSHRLSEQCVLCYVRVAAVCHTGLLLHLITTLKDARVRARTHTHKHTHSVGLLWTRDRVVAMALFATQHSQKTDRQTDMPPVEFESEIQASKRLPTYTSDRTFTREGQRSKPSAGFAPAIPKSERTQTYVLEREAAGIGLLTD
jgi:hypothetical protein